MGLLCFIGISPSLVLQGFCQFSPQISPAYPKVLLYETSTIPPNSVSSANMMGIHSVLSCRWKYWPQFRFQWCFFSYQPKLVDTKLLNVILWTQHSRYFFILTTWPTNSYFMSFITWMLCQTVSKALICYIHCSSLVHRVISSQRTIVKVGWNWFVYGKSMLTILTS